MIRTSARGIVEIVEQEGIVSVDHINLSTNMLLARVAELEAALKNTDDALEDSKIVIEPMRVITQRQEDWKSATLDKISKARNAIRALLSSAPVSLADATRALLVALGPVDAKTLIRELANSGYAALDVAKTIRIMLTRGILVLDDNMDITLAEKGL